MIICNTCENIIPDDSLFCPFCGNKITREQKKSVEAEEQLLLYKHDALLKRAFLFIEEGLFEKADEYIETVLNQDPENAQAHLGKLMIEMNVKTPSDLACCEKTFDKSLNYQRVIRFGDSTLIDEINGYMVSTKKKLEEKAEAERKESLYSEAMKKYNYSYDIKQVEWAIDAFSSLGDYKDSREKIELCKTRIDQIKIKQEEYYIKEKKEQKVYIIIAIIAISIIALIIVMNAVIIPNSQYNDAIALMDDGEYEEAIYLFESLNNYKDSVEKISECNMLFAEKKYDNACTLIDNNQYSEAVVIFRSLGEYKDSAEKVGLCEEKIIEKFEKENRLSGYIEVTIDQLMRNYLKYNGKKIKVVGSIYRLFYETPTFAEYHYEGALVNSNYFVLENRLDFRIMKSDCKDDFDTGYYDVDNQTEVVFYGTFTFNSSIESGGGNRHIADPFRWDLLVEKYIILSIGEVK